MVPTMEPPAPRSRWVLPVLWTIVSFAMLALLWYLFGELFDRLLTR